MVYNVKYKNCSRLRTSSVSDYKKVEADYNLWIYYYLGYNFYTLLPVVITLVFLLFSVQMFFLWLKIIKSGRYSLIYFQSSLLFILVFSHGILRVQYVPIIFVSILHRLIQRLYSSPDFILIFFANTFLVIFEYNFGLWFCLKN